MCCPGPFQRRMCCPPMLAMVSRQPSVVTYFRVGLATERCFTQGHAPSWAAHIQWLVTVGIQRPGHLRLCRKIPVGRVCYQALCGVSQDFVRPVLRLILSLYPILFPSPINILHSKLHFSQQILKATGLLFKQTLTWEHQHNEYITMELLIWEEVGGPEFNLLILL